MDKHIMVDLETLGTSNNAVIMSIAAVEFNWGTKNISEGYQASISIQSCLDSGLVVDGDTIKWWLTQDSRVMAKQLNEAEHLQKVLVEFSKLITKSHIIWGNSARFDLGILENAYRKCYLAVPWDHKNERDVRTIASLAPEIKKSMSFAGDKHDPLDDCLHQIKYVKATYEKLGITA